MPMFSWQVFIYSGVLLLSLGAAFLLTLFLEVPFLALEKVMFANTPRNRLKYHIDSEETNL